jgi:hypothetical protein
VPNVLLASVFLAAMVALQESEDPERSSAPFRFSVSSWNASMSTTSVSTQ